MQPESPEMITELECIRAIKVDVIVTYGHYTITASSLLCLTPTPVSLYVQLCPPPVQPPCVLTGLKFRIGAINITYINTQQYIRQRLHSTT